jgi:hypothetical protein
VNDNFAKKIKVFDERRTGIYTQIIREIKEPKLCLKRILKTIFVVVAELKPTD